MPALVWLVMFIEGAGPLDRQVLVGMYAGSDPLLAGAARFVTFFGSGYVVSLVGAAAALLLCFRGRPWPALVLLPGILAGRLFVNLQKYELNRLRPDANPHLVEVTSLSFPSGHAANATMAYLAIALLVPQNERSRRILLIAAVALALLVGVSRVMLGVHWPSDVIAGWSFGLLWVLVMLWVAERADPARNKGRAQ